MKKFITSWKFMLTVFSVCLLIGAVTLAASEIIRYSHITITTATQVESTDWQTQANNLMSGSTYLNRR